MFYMFYLLYLTYLTYIYYYRLRAKELPYEAVKHSSQDSFYVSDKLPHEEIADAEIELCNSRFWVDCPASETVELKQCAQVWEDNKREDKSEDNKSEVKIIKRVARILKIKKKKR
jgi:hypothetical protein